MNFQTSLWHEDYNTNIDGEGGDDFILVLNVSCKMTSLMRPVSWIRENKITHEYMKILGVKWQKNLTLRICGCGAILTETVGVDFSSEPHVIGDRISLEFPTVTRSMLWFWDLVGVRITVGELISILSYQEWQKLSSSWVWWLNTSGSKVTDKEVLKRV